MEKTNVMNAITSKQLGAIRTITYGKDFGNGVEKSTKGYVRFINSYENLSVVKEARANGVEKSNKNYTDIYVNNFIMVNKDGLEKVRVYTIPNNDNLKSTSVYVYNGKEIEKAELEKLGLIPIKKPSAKPITTYTIFLKDIISID